MDPSEKAKGKSSLDTFHSDVAKALPPISGALNGRVVTRLTPYLLHSTTHPLSSAYINLIKDDLIAASKMVGVEKIKVKTSDGNSPKDFHTCILDLKQRLSRCGARLEKVIKRDSSGQDTIKLAASTLKEIQECTDRAIRCGAKILSPAEQQGLSELKSDVSSFAELLKKQHISELITVPLPTSTSAVASTSKLDWSKNGSTLIAEQTCRLIDEIEDCQAQIEEGSITFKLSTEETKELLNHYIEHVKQWSAASDQNLSLEDITRLFLKTISSQRRLALIEGKHIPQGYQLQEKDQKLAKSKGSISGFIGRSTLYQYQFALFSRNIFATFLAKRLEAKEMSLTETKRPMKSIFLLKEALPKLQALLTNVTPQIEKSPSYDNRFYLVLEYALSTWERPANKWTDDVVKVGMAQKKPCLPLVSEIGEEFVMADFDTTLTEYTLSEYAKLLKMMPTEIHSGLAEKIGLMLIGFAVIDHCLAGEFKSQITSIVDEPRPVQEESESKSAGGMSKNQRKKMKRLKNPQLSVSEALTALPKLFKRENARSFFKEAAMHLAVLQQSIGSSSSEDGKLLETLLGLAKQYEYCDGAFDQHKLAMEKYEEEVWPPQANEPTASSPEMTDLPLEVDPGDDDTSFTYPGKLELTPEQSKLDDEKEEHCAEVISEELDSSDDDTSLKYSGKLELTGEPSDSEEEEDEFDMPPANEPVAKAGQPSSSSSSSKFPPTAFKKRERNKLWGQRKKKEKPTLKPVQKEQQREEVQDRRITKYTPFNVKDFRKTNDFTKMALQRGYSLLRHGANHDIYFNKDTQDTLTVPRHKGKDLRTGLLHTLARKAHQKKGPKS